MDKVNAAFQGMSSADVGHTSKGKKVYEVKPLEECPKISHKLLNR